MRLIILALAALVLTWAASGARSYAAESPLPKPTPPPFDLQSIIDIHSAVDAQTLRRALIGLLWCGSLPGHSPTWAGDRFSVSMDFGLQSIGRLHLPDAPNNRLLIYHHGHTQPLGTSPEIIETFTAQGYTVAELTMPGMGDNRGVWALDPDFGRVWVDEYHYNFAMLKPPCGHPMRYFLEPVIVFLNWAEAQGYSDMSMMGLSGGGWTTTLIAAIDPRISRSFPVAGSVPEYMRIGNNFGDWEQFAPEVYRVANYLELYVMATDGGRLQLQILNEFDPCCFAGRAAEEYAPVVAERAGRWGGVWALWIDSAHRGHIVSPGALGRVIEALNRELLTPTPTATPTQFEPPQPPPEPTPTPVAPALVATPTAAILFYLPIIRQ